MSIDIVVGAQYGDESKGKIVDYLCSTYEYDICAKVNGSDNAGHSVVLDGKKLAFNQIPIGAIHGMKCVIARGCVIDIDKLEEEIIRIEGWIKSGLMRGGWTLFIDERCHIKTKEHRVRDAQEEKSRLAPIGTTLSGNGPAYSDKYARKTKRICECFVSEHPNLFRKALICDTSMELNGKVIVEGSHGVMLDIDHGTYPFCTSSTCTPSGAINSLGASARNIGRAIGVIKPYVTRIGAGAFPAEITGELAQEIRDKGKEYGTVTGRPRRISWFDMPALAYAVRVAGITELALCKVDVLGENTPLNVCAGYDGIPFGRVPALDENYDKVSPMFETAHGSEDLARMIEERVHVPVTMVSSSPERGNVIIRPNAGRVL